ncbi:MAG: iron chelate uptake ABC transporter family permease subunit [Clostridia bacterium]|nr:iron chelate uptake ABC transporter family permease subunit [Clostridia bacterium]
MMEIFQYEFMRNAVIAAVLVNIACGIVGTYVVIKKIVFISGGISHAAFGGIGLGYFLGIPPIVAAIPFSLISAITIGLISKRSKLSEDAAIGIIWAVGMASGIIFINLTPGYAPDLFSYLFGNILTIPVSDLYIMFAMDLIVILIVALFFKEFYAISFDEEFSTVTGIPNRILYLVILCMVALSVVVLIRIVGIILVIALLTIPSSICRQFTYNMKKLIISSIVTGIILTITGLWISYLLDLASGATIILLLALVFLLSFFIKKAVTAVRRLKTR